MTVASALPGTPHRVANLKPNFGGMLSCEVGHVQAQGPIEGSPPTWSPKGPAKHWLQCLQICQAGTRLLAPLASVPKLEAPGDSCLLSLGGAAGPDNQPTLTPTPAQVGLVSRAFWSSSPAGESLDLGHHWTLDPPTHRPRAPPEETRFQTALGVGSCGWESASPVDTQSGPGAKG